MGGRNRRRRRDWPHPWEGAGRSSGQRSTLERWCDGCSPSELQRWLAGDRWVERMQEAAMASVRCRKPKGGQETGRQLWPDDAATGRRGRIQASFCAWRRPWLRLGRAREGRVRVHGGQTRPAERTGALEAERGVAAGGSLRHRTAVLEVAPWCGGRCPSHVTRERKR